MELAFLENNDSQKWTIKGRYPEREELNDIGPGQYANIDMPPTNLGPTMKGRRGQENIDNNIPGPGYYNAKSTLNSNGSTIKGRHKK